MLGVMGFVLMAVIAGSAMTCVDWWNRWARFGDLWQPVKRPKVTWNPIAVAVGLGFAALSLLTIPDHDPNAATKLPSLKAIELDTLYRGLLLSILLVLLPSGDLRRLPDFGITLTDWPRQIWDGLELAIGSLLPVMLVLLITATSRHPDQQHAYLQLLQKDGSTEMAMWLILSAVVLAPLLEELLFRVLLLGWLRERMSSRWSIAISSSAFAAMHGLLDGIALVPLAILLGWNFDRRRRYFTVATAHAAFNLWNVLLVLCSSP